MPEYYIRTPEQDESRGPFDQSRLKTLVDAGQVTENTLYYDEEKEEWIPVALNEELKQAIFPVANSLKLRAAPDAAAETSSKKPKGGGGIEVEDMLKAAEADTKETRHLKQRQKSFEKAVELAPITLGIMMILSALALLIPHHPVIVDGVTETAYTSLLNYPFLMLGIFDLVMAILLLLSVTDVYPVIRGRSMLGLGFGVYLGWALGDPTLIMAFALGGAGIFLATIAQRLSTMLLAIIMGIGGNGALAYLAINERFAEFYSSIKINIF